MKVIRGGIPTLVSNVILDRPSVISGITSCLLAWCMLAGPAPIGAQVAPASLGVLRYSPTDSVSAGTLITVTFNRPVAGMAGQHIDAGKVMRLMPSIAGQFEWRDPATLRFVPDEPFVPGTRVTVSIDTAAVASNLSRTAAPYSFNVRFPGATPLARQVDGKDYGNIGPLPRFTVWYSAPVNLDSLARVSRVEFTGNCKRTVKLRPVRQRAPQANDPVPYQLTADFDRDTVADRFRRIVDLVPEDSLPPDCSGHWFIDAVEGAPSREAWQYNVTTYPAFRVTRVDPCVRDSPCDPDGLAVHFSAPVRMNTALKAVRTFPQLPLPVINSADYTNQTSLLVYNTRLTPRNSYTVTVDSSIRDVFGRKLQGPTSFTVSAHDRVPGVIQQNALVTVARLAGKAPTIAVRTVNVDTLLMLVTRIPDSLTAELLSTEDYRRYEFLRRVSSQLTDTITLRYPVHAPFNTEVNTQIPLPPEVFARSAPRYAAIRFAIGARSIAPDSQRPRPPKPIAGVGTVRPSAKTATLPMFKITATADFGSIPDLGQIVHVSNLVAHAKIAQNEGVAYVTDHAGNPVANARVALFGPGPNALAAASTDAAGLARLNSAAPLRSSSSTRDVVRDPALDALRYLKVTRGRDELIVPVNARIATAFDDFFELSRFGARTEAAARVHGTITSDRDLYRPGELIYVKVIARAGIAGAATVPVGDSVRVVLQRGQFRVYDAALPQIADTVAVWRSTLSKFGTASDSIRIPVDVRIGTYSLQADVLTRGTWQRLPGATIRVEEFRAPEFLVTLHTDSAVHYPGDTIAFKLDAKYLFGAPMSGITFSWSSRLAEADGNTFTIPRTDGYSVGLNNWWDPSEAGDTTRLDGKGKFDRDGSFAFRIPTSAQSISKPALLKVSAAVVDLSNQVVTTTRTVAIQGASRFIGAKFRGSDFAVAAGTSQTVDVIVVNERGDRVPDVPVTAVIIRRWFTSDSTSNAPAGGWHWAADTIDRVSMRSTRDSVGLRFTPKLDGAYDIRLHANDELGRPTATNVGRYTYSAFWSYRGRPSPTALRITTANRKDTPYALGDTAHLSFDSPFANADAWITYEREGVLEQRTIRVRKGTNSLHIPVTARFAPNIWVGVALFPRSDKAIVTADSINQLVRIGFTEIRVDSTAHRLRVTITPTTSQLSPGDSVHVQVRVVDISNAKKVHGIRSEVALWAVDEGVLSATGFKTPDILSAIDRRTGIAQSFRTSLATFPWFNPAAPVRPGSNVRLLNDGRSLSAFATTMVQQDAPPAASLTLQPSTLRSDFRLTAFFVGNATTDSSGTVSIKARLPDNITTFRLMASAVGTGSRYGSGEGSLLVTRRVILRSALPRFVRYGDTFSANATLNVRSGDDGKFAVSGSATGASFGGNSTTIVFASEGKGATVRFPLAIPARAEADITRVTFTATDVGNGDGDAVVTSIPIRATGTPRAHTITGMVRDSGTITMQLPTGIDIEHSSLTFGTGTSPMVAMRSHYDRLRAYTYINSDCIVSAARALLSLANVERALKEPLLTRDSVAFISDIQQAVNSLVSRQDRSGDFAYFPDISITMGPWFTAIAGGFLLDAQGAGAKVPAASLALIKASMDRVLSAGWPKPDTITGSPAERTARLRAYLGMRVEILRYLRRAGEANIAAEDAIFATGRMMAWEDRVALADLMSQRTGTHDEARAMLQQLWSAVRVAGRRVEVPDSLRGYGWSFPSHIRPAARLQVTSMKLLPDHPLLGALNETIIQQSAAETEWAWNVQDHGAAIEALAAFAIAQRGDSGARVVVRNRKGETLIDQSTRGASADAIDATTKRQPLSAFLAASTSSGASLQFSVSLHGEPGTSTLSRNTPLYYAVTVQEVPFSPPVTPDIGGIVVERWYENYGTGAPITQTDEGDLVRVRLRVTVPSDRQFVALEDLLPAGLEAVDLSLRTSSELAPFANAATQQHASQQRLGSVGPIWQSVLYGSWDNGWFSPWEYKEMRDDRVFYFARQLWAGTYNASYVARATTSGTFIKPPAHAEEMYNAAVQGRSDGGTFVIREKRN